MEGPWVVIVGFVDNVENMDTIKGYNLRVLKKITSGPFWRVYTVGTIDIVDMLQFWRRRWRQNNLDDVDIEDVVKSMVHNMDDNNWWKKPLS